MTPATTPVVAAPRRLAAAVPGAVAGLGALAVAAGLALVGIPAAHASSGVGTTGVTTAAAAPLRVMPLGDSITMGIGTATMSSYRVDLQNRLRAAGLAVDFVGSQRHGSPATADLDHEGHSGWTVAKIASRVDGWLVTHRPDAVLLMIGTNDVRTAAGAAGAPERLSGLIDRIRAARPQTDVFVAKITGTRGVGAAPQQKRTDAYNARIPGIVAAKGPRVHLVDQSTVRLIDIRDGLHPNDVGAAKMSWNWYQAMSKVYRATAGGWPQTGNPYRATRGRYCHLVDAAPGKKWSPHFDCRWYHRNLVARKVGGKTVKTWTWQAKHTVTTKKKVYVKGHYATKKVTGSAKKVKVWVKGRYVTRTSTSSRWVSFDQNRRDL